MKRRKYLNQKGFSLMEILIVLTLIAIGGTFVVNTLIDRLNEGQVSAAKSQIKNYATLLEDYRRYCNRYPSTDEGLDALIEKPAESTCKRYPPNGFIQGGKLQDDPWGAPYEYESENGRSYVIRSFGRDGQPGGDGFDADINSKDL